MTTMTQQGTWGGQGVLVADAAYRAPRTNTMSIAAMWTAVAGCTVLFGLPAAPVAVILGFVALSQCRTRGEAGKDLAIWSIVLGIASVVLAVTLFVLLMIALINIGVQAEQLEP